MLQPQHHKVDAGRDRVYDVEIDKEKYYFLFTKNSNGWDVVSEDSMRLEKLLRETNLFFTGEPIV